MPKHPLLWIPAAAMIAALGSCAAPKAEVAEKSVTGVPNAVAQQPEPEESTPAPLAASPPDDGIRLPDMMMLPGENEFRKPSPITTGSGGSGAVIARPPSE
jgi:hypothetical protein